jgi:hypothetical protein
MSAVTTFTILLLFESRLLATAESIMLIFCIWLLLTCVRVVIQGTVLQTTIPAPRATTPKILMEFVLVIQATGKDVRTCVILQAPTLTPGALPSIIHSFLWLRFLRGSVFYRGVHTDRTPPQQPAPISNFCRMRTTLDCHLYTQNREP